MRTSKKSPIMDLIWLIIIALCCIDFIFFRIEMKEKREEVKIKNQEVNLRAETPVDYGRRRLEEICAYSAHENVCKGRNL